jgi:anti-sigma B factor antagonist
MLLEASGENAIRCVAKEPTMDHSTAEFENTIVLRVRGELDALSSPELRPIVNTLTRDKGCTIRVDLSELEHLDSSGVQTLVSLHKQARANGGSVSFVGVADQPLTLLKILRLDRVFALAA